MGDCERGGRLFLQCQFGRGFLARDDGSLMGGETAQPPIFSKRKGTALNGALRAVSIDYLCYLEEKLGRRKRL